MPATLRQPKNSQLGAPSKDALAAVKRALDEMDWANYWQKVGERVAKEVDAYAAARAKSWEDSSRRMMR